MLTRDTTCGARPVRVVASPAATEPWITSDATHIRFRTVTSCPGAGAAPFPPLAVITSAVTNSHH